MVFLAVVLEKGFQTLGSSFLSLIFLRHPEISIPPTVPVDFTTKVSNCKSNHLVSQNATSKVKYFTPTHVTVFP